MPQPFLNSKTIEIAGKEVTLYEMGAMPYLDYRQYMVDYPIDLDATGIASEREIVRVYSRVIAHGLVPDYPDKSIDDLQQMVQNQYNPAAIYSAHEVVANLCGWGAPSNESETEEGEPQTQGEPISPKS
jgi:hypothetical protein